jgi:hypothetical protein
MKVVGKSTRLQERIKLSLPLRARYRQSAEREWIEETQTSEVTRFGAGFILKHLVEPRRLIHLSLPLPRHLRAFDLNEKDYRVWSIVRYVRMLAPDASDRIRIHVGAAFIGKNAPPEFEKDPTKRYDLKPVLDGGVWSARELPRCAGRFARTIETRYPIRERATVELIGEDGAIARRGAAETLNVSESGAAVLTNIQVARDSFVRLVMPECGCRLLAVVRGSHPESGNLSRLHLEFISGKLPATLLN